MMSGAAYIRVSTDDQTEFSLDAQLKAIKNYAKQNGILLTNQHVYVDEGISGKRADKRPAFMQMIGTAKLKPAPFDIILVHKFDRFARSREDSVVYKSMLRKECGVKVVSITESIEDDKFSVILEAMLEAMAEYYSLNLAEEVLKGMTEKAERGGLQNAAPLGYTVVNNKLVVDELEAKIVKVIFLKFVNREMNMRQIAVLLNDIGARSKRGNLLENRTIQYILQNPVYIGKLRWTPEKIPNAYRYHNTGSPETIIRDGGHEPIIDEHTFNLAQQRLAETKDLYGHRQKPDAKCRTWLKGLVYCGNCGKTLVLHAEHYLQCNGYSKGQCAKSCSIRFDVLERFVLAELKTVFVGEIEINLIPRKADEAATEEFEAIKSALDKFNSREQRMKEAFQCGIDTINEYEENKKLLAAEKERLVNRMKQLRENLSNQSDKPIHRKIKDIHTLLSSSDTDMGEKYAAAHFLINKIVFTKDKSILEIEFKE